jgi:enoyl-[acyl-carrier protein] reductase I
LRVRSVTWRPNSVRSASACTLSPGPLKTRAASGIERFDELLERARARTPEHRLVSIEDVGNLAVFLVSDAATALTGNIEYIDAGYHIVG